MLDSSDSQRLDGLGCPPEQVFTVQETSWEKIAMLGSVNFSPASLDRRRELAIEIDAAAAIKTLQATLAHDWSHSRPIDLSEEGLREELERHGRADDAYHLLGEAPEEAG